MWRPNPSLSERITLIRLNQNSNNFDEYGNPRLSFRCTALSAEVYPYSDAIKRQAFGITSEQAFTLILQNVKVNSDDVVMMQDIVYRIRSISSYEPLQLIVESTGQGLGEYLQTKSEV